MSVGLASQGTETAQGSAATRLLIPFQLPALFTQLAAAGADTPPQKEPHRSMTERRDPESTRCTFVIPSRDEGLFRFGGSGDRIEMYEERDGKETGFVLTARILSVARLPRDAEPPGPGVVLPMFSRKV